MEELIVEKAKSFIKCLDANINVAHDFLTSYTIVFLSHTLANTKFAAFATAQAYTAKAKTATQASANFKSITQSHFEPNKDKDDYCSKDSKVYGYTHIVANAITVNSAIVTSGPSPNL